MKINGQQIAQSILESLRKEVELLKSQGIIPHLAVIIVGENQSSAIYVRQKELKANQLGPKFLYINLKKIFHKLNFFHLSTN